ncbi:MAG TPA: DUF3592 domain-containing protein [Prosthecobacter sp.]
MHPRAVRPVKQMSGGCAVLFGLPFLVAGLAIGWFLYFPAISSWWSARNWEQVPCWIEKADMESSRSKNSTVYNTKARYRYIFDGRTYHSEEVSLLGGGSDNVGDFQQKAYAQIRAHEGQERPFRCFVNPERPQQAVLFRDLRWGLMLMMSLFPMIFPLAGCLVSVGGFLQSRSSRAEKRLEERHPGEPWRWKREWAGDVIQPSARALGFQLAAAGWILLVQGPLAGAIIVSGELGTTPLAALALLPASLALIPLFFAWRHVQTRRALGTPSLWLKRTPISPGGTLEGELRFDRALSPMANLEVSVFCRRHITRRSGKSTSTTKETVWRHADAFSAADTRREITGVALPLRVDIPRGAPCPVIENAMPGVQESEKHVWTLEVRPSGSGRAVVLPLPVFVTDAGAEEAMAEIKEEEPMEIAPDDLAKRLRARSVNVEFSPEGIPRVVDCPPARFRGSGLFILVFGVVWSIIFVVMASSGAPFIFNLIWGVTSPLILGAAIWTLLHHRRVEITDDGLRLINKAGPFYSSHQSFEPRHFVSFAHDSNMQSGNQFYYRVRGETVFGKKVTLADGITESVAAEALARRFEDWREKGAQK